MTERKTHFKWGSNRYTECGIDSWVQPMSSTHFIEIVSCKTCLKKLGYDVKGV